MKALLRMFLGTILFLFFSLGMEGRAEDAFVTTVSLDTTGSIVSISPTEGTIGTQITISGSGFGTKKGTVKVGGKMCKILGEWTNESITCEIKVALPPPGPYDIVVKPKAPRGALPITYEDGFTLMVPEITSFSPDSGSVGDEIELSGNYFGAKKGKVYLQNPDTGKKRNCKVITWGMNSITFAVPKTSNAFPEGSYPLKVSNKVGIGDAESDFTLLDWVYKECEGGPYLLYCETGTINNPYFELYWSDTGSATDEEYPDCSEVGGGVLLMVTEYCNARSVANLHQCLNKFLPFGIGKDDDGEYLNELTRIETQINACESLYW